MFHRRGRVRVALSEQDVTNGGVDKLFDQAIAAGAEDFDQVPVPGTGKGVEIEVNQSISEFAASTLSHEFVWPPIDHVCTECVGKDYRSYHPIWPFTGTVIQ